jgi:Sulfotransferase family
MKDLVFHIGHHKTATTWLQTGYFSEHPQIRLAAEFHTPWNDAFLAHLIGSTERSFSVSECRSILEKKLLSVTDDPHKVIAISAERLSGHPYSGGYDSYIIANRIHACFPEARIIMSIRNQIDMLISVYKQLVLEGYLGTFTDMIGCRQWKGTAFSLDMYKYDRLISRYIELFSRERLLILTYENFLNNKIGYINLLSNFLGVPYFEASNFNTVVNQATSERQIRATRVLNYFRKSELNPFPLLEITPSISRRLEKIFAKVLGDLRFDDEQLEYLRRYYAPSNVVLRKLLNDDLEGYP